MMMHVMVAAKHDASAYFLSSAAVKHHGFCHVADTVFGPTLGSLVAAPNVFESVAPLTVAGVRPWLAANKRIDGNIRCDLTMGGTVI
jgi:hypothetical protein